MAEMVSVERDGRVAVVRFDRGDGRNALSHDLMRELLGTARALEDDGGLSAVVLAGAPEVFSLGFDLTDPLHARLEELPLGERRQVVKLGSRLCRAWEELEPMTIAAVEGWCVGGGLALAGSCDLRVLGTGATLYTPEIERGMNMAWNSVPRLVSLVGPARAKRLVILAEKVGAERALEWGLADEVVADGTAVERALELAGRIAALPPIPVRMCKQGINAAAAALNAAVSVMDGDQHLLARTSEDFTEGVRSFLEKRPPRYSGR